MFIEWDFLLVEIWVLIALAAFIGLIAGWLIWGARPDIGADADEVRRLRAELDVERARRRSVASGSQGDMPKVIGGGYTRPTPMTPPRAPVEPTAVAPETGPETAPEPEPTVEPDPVPAPDPTPDMAPDPASDTKPTALDVARDGLPDELRKINGVGRKLEKLLNSMGIYHFDQIADWTNEEIAWVDDNLEGFKGRVTRDEWVPQAKALARNETPAFKRSRT